MYISLCIALLTLWYGFGFLYIVRKRGLDPSLVTYISPLQLKKSWIARGLLACALLLSFLQNPFAELLALLLVSFGVFHVFLLAVFARTATQPILFYIVYICAAATLFYQMPLVSISLFTLQEFALTYWSRTQSQRYQAWVARQTHRIHTTYKGLGSSMSAQEWFFVLHFAVTENIARPKIVRIAEHAYYYLKKPTVISTGIMQVAAPRPMSDTQSMQKGAEILKKALHTIPKDITDPIEQIKWLARMYNGSTTYSKYLLATYPGVRQAWQEIKK